PLNSSRVRHRAENCRRIIDAPSSAPSRQRADLGRDMFAIPAPTGGAAHIPETAREDREYFTKFDFAAKEYLATEGYVVVRKLIDPAVCAAIREAFELEIKSYPGFLYRQTTARAERNRFNSLGHVMNPLLNLQDLDPERFSRLRQRSLNVFTAPAVTAALR